jgi:hypothetical protein
MAESDTDQAAREADARRHLLRAGASSLPRPPWRHRNQPPPAIDLIQFALAEGNTRSGNTGGRNTRPRNAGGNTRQDAGEEVLLAALTLLPAARAEVDQLEAGLLFAARSAGLSWPQIARALGFASAQAAQQRFDRVSGRVENRQAGG